MKSLLSCLINFSAYLEMPLRLVLCHTPTSGNRSTVNAKQFQYAHSIKTMLLSINAKGPRGDKILPRPCLLRPIHGLQNCCLIRQCKLLSPTHFEPYGPNLRVPTHAACLDTTRIWASTRTLVMEYNERLDSARWLENEGCIGIDKIWCNIRSFSSRDLRR